MKSVWQMTAGHGGDNAGGAPPGEPPAAAGRGSSNRSGLIRPRRILPSSRRFFDARVGRVSFGGVVKEVNLAYVPEAVVGDYVVVHVGFAISKLDELEAQQVFEYLKQMDELVELRDER